MTTLSDEMDESAIAVLRHFAICNGGAVLENSSLIAAASIVDYAGPVHNAVIAKGSSVAPSQIIEAAEAFFEPKRRQYILWIRHHADLALSDLAQSRGFLPRGAGSGAAAMYIRTPLARAGEPDGLRLVLVEKPSQVETFADVVAQAFAGRQSPQPRAASLALFSEPRVIICPAVTAFMAYRHGVAVGGAMVIMEAGLGSLCWVSTVPDARGLGIATLLTIACTNAAFDRGASLVALQSSSMGEGVYRRIGFEEATRYQRLISPEPRSRFRTE